MGVFSLLFLDSGENAESSRAGSPFQNCAKQGCFAQAYTDVFTACFGRGYQPATDSEFSADKELVNQFVRSCPMGRIDKLAAVEFLLGENGPVMGEGQEGQGSGYEQT